jgi:hypothetical protein
VHSKERGSSSQSYPPDCDVGDPLSELIRQSFPGERSITSYKPSTRLGKLTGTPPEFFNHLSRQPYKRKTALI